MKACLDLHDFSISFNRLDYLLRLKNHFSSFKVSLFSIPIDNELSWGPYTIRRQALKEIKRNLDWIQLIPHGLIHARFEMRKVGYNEFRKFYIPKIKEIFDSRGLPYEKGFCPPHWRWNDQVTKALDDEGWWGAIDRNMVMARPKRFYQYNYLLNEPFYEAEGDLKLHGHIYGTKNDIGLCFDNLLKLPKDTEWHYVTDFLETNEAI